MKNNYIDPIPPELRQVLAWTEKLNELTRDVPIVNELSQLKENCLVEETSMATAIKQTVRPLTNGITDLGIDMGCSPIMEENRKITEMFQPAEMFNAIKQTEAFNNLVNIKKLYSFHDVTSEWIINPLTTFLYETNYIKVNEFNNALSNESLEFTKSIEPLCVSPVIDWINQISVFSQRSIFEVIVPSYDKALLELYYRIIMKELYRSRWFPHVISKTDLKMGIELISVIRHTKESKNRTTKINRIIYSYYGKKKIDNIIRKCKHADVSPVIARIIRQAIQAYIRGEYALTAITLSTVWERIIYEKVDDNSRKQSKKTKENFMQLTINNGFSEIYSTYFNDLIFYQCESEKDVIKDVPGRHKTAHGWHNTYPSKKEALNAILVTDFLLNIEPLNRYTIDIERRKIK